LGIPANRYPSPCQPGTGEIPYKILIIERILSYAERLGFPASGPNLPANVERVPDFILSVTKGADFVSGYRRL
jgi:hypothetical protein